MKILKNAALTAAAMTAMALATQCTTATKPAAQVNATKLPTDTIALLDGSWLQISFIRHASLAMNCDGQVIYVDPVANFTSDSTFHPDYASMDKADLILITHAHGDHFDSTVIKTLSKETTLVILNGESQQKFGSGETLGNGESRIVGNWLTVTAVPAHNVTPGKEMFHPANGRDNGYVLEFAGCRVYISGDTEVVPDVVCDPAKPVDIAFLSVNQPYTMTLEQATAEALKLKPRILYPIHYGDTEIDKLPGMLEGSGIDVRIRQMQ